MVPSGRTSARYSPPPASPKLECNGAPGVRRSLFEAKITRNDPAFRLVAGKRHAFKLSALSVSDQFRRLTLVELRFWISIQSGDSPSSSNNVRELLAMNSVITTCAELVNGVERKTIPASNEHDKVFISGLVGRRIQNDDVMASGFFYRASPLQLATKQA